MPTHLSQVAVGLGQSVDDVVTERRWLVLVLLVWVEKGASIIIVIVSSLIPRLRDRMRTPERLGSCSFVAMLRERVSENHHHLLTS